MSKRFSIYLLRYFLFRHCIFAIIISECLLIFESLLLPLVLTSCVLSSMMVSCGKLAVINSACISSVRKLSISASARLASRSRAMSLYRDVNSNREVRSLMPLYEADTDDSTEVWWQEPSRKIGLKLQKKIGYFYRTVDNTQN